MRDEQMADLLTAMSNMAAISMVHDQSPKEVYQKAEAHIDSLCDLVSKYKGRIAATDTISTLTSERDAALARVAELEAAVKAAWIEGEWAGQQNREDTAGNVIEFEDSKASAALSAKETPDA